MYYFAKFSQFRKDIVLKIISVCPNSFAANTYLLVSGRKAFVVDPSVSVKAIESILGSESSELCGILLTHGHFDHTVSVDTVRDKFNIQLMIHQSDACMLTNGKINGFFDFYGKECVHRPAEKLLADGESITLGNESIKVISTPGHSEGSVCFLCNEDQDNSFLITGDTLFSNSIGRCDLYGGNNKKMCSSLQLLSELGGKMEIYPGHGASCSLSDALNSARYYIEF